MNDEMFANPATRANLETLRERRVAIVGPEIGATGRGPVGAPGPNERAGDDPGARGATASRRRAWLASVSW